VEERRARRLLTTLESALATERSPARSSPRSDRSREARPGVKTTNGNGGRPPAVLAASLAATATVSRSE
jgi:hypothetical protein